jgi:putative zinc finger/helix-turn-helix YgiT family protein
MNIPPKPAKSFAGKSCRACGHGKFELVQIDHSANVANDNPIAIPNIWVDRCNHCGEILFPGDTVHYIETVVAEETEQLTGRDLEQIREDLGVDRQDEMSEILGLGTKTFHKWESSSQLPTRSMCYYIRLLAKFPEAFDWLRRREWRNANRLTGRNAKNDFSAMFPDLQISEDQNRLSPEIIDRVVSLSSRRNPALGLSRVAFLVK